MVCTGWEETTKGDLGNWVVVRRKPIRVTDFDQLFASSTFGPGLCQSKHIALDTTMENTGAMVETRGHVAGVSFITLLRVSKALGTGCCPNLCEEQGSKK